MGQRKNKLTKKERKQLRLICSQDFFENSFDLFDDPDEGEIHYTDFVCSNCGIHENIPTHIVMELEDIDKDSVPNYMPSFACEKCGHDMFPTYFKGYTGKVYQYEYKSK